MSPRHGSSLHNSKHFWNRGLLKLNLKYCNFIIVADGNAASILRPADIVQRNVEL